MNKLSKNQTYYVYEKRDGYMKKIFIFVIILMVSLIIVKGEEVKIIENPENPQAKNARRIISLEEVSRISDEKGDFFFKEPRNIKVAPDATIYMIDKEQFLHFDKQGKFLSNQQKKGQGPGEYLNIHDFQFMDNKIVIYTSRPFKIIETDLKGNLIKEYKLDHNMRFLRVLGLFKGKYWFVGSSVGDFFKKNTGETVVKLELSYVSFGTKVEKSGLIIPEKCYMLKRESKEGYIQIAFKFQVRSFYIMDTIGNLYVMNSQKYLISHIDLEKRKIGWKFRRNYSSIPYKEEALKEQKTRIIGPKPKYFADIQYIILTKEQIWIFTSTVIKGKGVLVDVFTKDGKYIDNFYLQLPCISKVNDLKDKHFTLYKNFLFTIEKDEDYNPVVVKYRLK